MATQKYKPSYGQITSNVDILSGKRILQYPLGLGSTALDVYGIEQHYMLFKINTDTKSMALKDDVKGGEVLVAANTRQATGVESTPGNFLRPNNKAVIRGGAKPSNAMLKNEDKDLRKLYGKAAVDNQEWLRQKGMVRLDKVIVLPMPMEHTVATSIKYNDDFSTTELTKLGDFLNNSASGIVNDMWTKLKNEGLVGAFNKFKATSTNEQAMYAEERKSKNPKKEVMFEGFGFRSYSFSYQFAPKSAEESEMVRDIIETFRYYALPELTDGKMFYTIPAEFEVSFMLGQNINPHIPKITTSVLRRVSVNYMPNSVWATLPNGAPLAISISLDFLELELVDRSRVFNEKQPIIGGY